MLANIVRWLRLHGTEKSRSERRFLPTLEQLAERAVPAVTTFTWTGASSNNWESNLNWTNDSGLTGPTAYPGGGSRTTDKVKIDTGSSVVSGATGGYTFGGIDFDGTVVGGLTVQFNGPINLTGDSWLSGNTTIEMINTSNTVTQSSGTFTWEGLGANIYGPSVSTFFIANGANLNYTSAGVNILGDTLNIQGGGTFNISAAGNIKLKGGATITNSGTINIKSQGVISRYNATDSAVTITNTGQGVIYKTADNSGQYTFREPILNQGEVDLEGGSGTLAILDSATTATKNVSFYNNGPGADLVLDTDAILYVDKGFQQDQGAVNCIGQGFNVQVQSDNGKFNLNGGGIGVGNTNDPGNYGTLVLAVAEFDWNNGGIVFTYDDTVGVASKISVPSPANNMIIARQGPTMSLNLIGAAFPNSMDVITLGAQQIIDNSDPAPPGWGGSVTGNGRVYTITQSGGRPLLTRAPKPPTSALSASLPRQAKATLTFVPLSYTEKKLLARWAYFAEKHRQNVFNPDFE